jgi:type IV pilus assembly protein PilA
MSEVVLAASACRTTVTEVYQSGTTTPAADGWGCESSSQSSKYVKAIHTDTNGVITVTATGFNDTNIDDKIVQLTPYKDASNTSAMPADSGKAVFKWVCGPAGTNGVLPKYLPGSCRG